MEVVDEQAGAAAPARNAQGKSTISKLSIRGIRSFDPNHEEGPYCITTPPTLHLPLAYSTHNAFLFHAWVCLF